MCPTLELSPLTTIFETLCAWYKATAVGELTLPAVTGIGMGWWTLLFVGILAFGAWGMSRLEFRFKHFRPPT